MVYLVLSEYRIYGSLYIVGFLLVRRKEEEERRGKEEEGRRSSC